MQAAELKRAIDIQIPDREASQAVCRAFRVLRRFLDANVTDQRGIGGRIFRALFPKTSEGIRAVVKLLEDYEREQCA